MEQKASLSKNVPILKHRHNEFDLAMD